MLHSLIDSIVINGSVDRRERHVKRGTTGHYEVTTTLGESVRAFVPAQLPPEPSIDLSNDLQMKLERANIACGRLDSIATFLPDPDLFIYGYVRREAVLSSQIEGTKSSLSDLLLFEMDEMPGVPFDDVVEVSNYVAAMEHGLGRLRSGFPLSSRLLREIHGELLASGRGSSQSPGEFRRSQNWIGGTRPGNAHFVPPPPAFVQECMADLERFIHDETSAMPALVRAGIAHAQFETIHPFLDGNGRVGRLLIALMLNVHQVLEQPLLYLSLYLKQNRSDYYRLLDTVRTDGDWEAWLSFFLDGVARTAAGAFETARRIRDLLKEDTAIVQEAGGSANLMRAYTAMTERPVTTISDLASRVGVAYPTATRALSNLEGRGIVREITGRARDRVFVYGKYLDVLSEGDEPL